MSASNYDLNGFWDGSGYQCPAGTFHQELLQITMTGNQISGTKLIGDDCVPASNVSFTGSATDTVQLYSVTWTTGYTYSPACCSATGTLQAITKDSIVARSSSDPYTANILTRRKQVSAFTVDGTRYEGVSYILNNYSDGTVEVGISIYPTNSGNYWNTANNWALSIFHIPPQSSGTFNFNSATTTNLSAIGFFPGTADYPETTGGGVSGSLTKTGANTFTFSCNLLDMVSHKTYSLTGGEGTY